MPVVGESDLMIIEFQFDKYQQAEKDDKKGLDYFEPLNTNKK